MPVLGVVENMSGLICPHCSQEIDVFKKGGGERMALEMNVPFLGSIPIDPEVVVASDAGVSFVSEHPDSPTAVAFEKTVQALLAGLNQTGEGGSGPSGDKTESGGSQTSPSGKESARARADESEGMPRSEKNPEDQKGSPIMKVAIPTAEGRLTPHFGHCRQFAIVEVADGRIKGIAMLEPPPHEPGVLPEWLHQQGVTHVIVGGMGQRAQGHFANKGIEVVIGAPALSPEELVGQYLDGTLQTGENICDH
jgi:predicted Fe-Mo cluster-binding NifX family protein